MEKLSLSKQLSIVRLYLGGFSYGEIAAKAGVSKGSVSNVITELRAGRILDVQEPVEQLDLLRELAIDLRRCRLTPGQTLAGLTVLSRLQELGVDPGDIEPWAALRRELAANEAEAQAFVQAALALEELRKRTGLSAEALEEKGRRLVEEVARLESRAQELQECQQELEELRRRRQGLADEVSQLAARYEPLSQSVTEKERREAELSHRVQRLEERVQAADERLAGARGEVKALEVLGLSPKDLTGLVQRMGGIAQRHGIEPGALRERLLHELEELETGLGLEALAAVKRHELAEAEQAIAKGQQERQALDSALQQLRQQQAVLRTSIVQEQEHVRKEIQTIAKIARDATAELRQDMSNGVAEALLEVQKLRNQAFELGQELGRFEATIEANEWLGTVATLVKGDGSISAGDVRVVGLAVLRGVEGWIQQNKERISLPFGLATRIGSIIEELERWKV